jgi:hypothetical protein
MNATYEGPEEAGESVSARKRLAIWTFSQKGGIGKTTLERAMRALARMHGTPSAAFDGEGPEGQFTQFEGTRNEFNELLDEKLQTIVPQDPLVGCYPFDVKDNRQRDLIVNLAANPYDLVFVDFPGGTLDQLQSIGFGPDGVSEIVEAWTDNGFQVVVVVPIGPLLYSVRSVSKAMDHFKGANVLVAMMGAFVDFEEDFIQYYGYVDSDGEQQHGNTRKRLLSPEEGGREMFVPKLSARTYSLLDARSLSFDAALDQPVKLVPDADKRRIRTYLKAVRSALPDDIRIAICGE